MKKLPDTISKKLFTYNPTQNKCKLIPKNKKMLLPLIHLELLERLLEKIPKINSTEIAFIFLAKGGGG